MRIGRFAFGIGVLFCLAMLPMVVTTRSSLAAAPTEEEAHAIAVDAYIYFYPLITMELTRQQLSNAAPGSGSIGGPMNAFNNIPTFPPADMRAVVRPNFDTLYSSAWLDLTGEPVLSRCRTQAGATISCRCSTCGRTSSLRRAGGRPEPVPEIS